MTHITSHTHRTSLSPEFSCSRLHTHRRPHSYSENTSLTRVLTFTGGFPLKRPHTGNSCIQKNLHPHNTSQRTPHTGYLTQNTSHITPHTEHLILTGYFTDSKDTSCRMTPPSHSQNSSFKSVLTLVGHLIQGTCRSYFSHWYNQIPDKKELKKRQACFGSQFRRKAIMAGREEVTAGTRGSWSQCIQSGSRD